MAMPSAVLLRTATVGVQSITTAANLGRHASGAHLKIAVVPVGLGYHRVLLYGVAGPRRGSDARRTSNPPAVLHRDVQETPSAEQELKIITPVVDEGIFELENDGDMARSNSGTETRVQRKMSRRKKEQRTYLFAAIASTTGFIALSASAVVYRFVWLMPESGAIPYGEIFGTFSLAVGAAVGMEYWARWAHRALWHASLWHMHESHHKPREGPFETNDVFAIINAVPAILLILYGFLNSGIVPAVCFGAGLGITMFGIAYMFVHDGLVHRRFPVGPIAEVPYFRKVAAAHQLHHADLFDGVPYGLFLGPKELEKVGGGPELEKWLTQRAKSSAKAADN